MVGDKVMVMAGVVLVFYFLSSAQNCGNDVEINVEMVRSGDMQNFVVCVENEETFLVNCIHALFCNFYNFQQFYVYQHFCCVQDEQGCRMKAP